MQNKACFQSICKTCVKQGGNVEKIVSKHFVIIFFVPEICDALDELVEEASDAIIKSEPETLYKTLKH